MIIGQKQVKLLLDSYGFTYVWINPDSVNLKTFHVLFKNCVLDNFKQAWWQNICNSGTLCTYKYLKTSLRLILTFYQKSSEKLCHNYVCLLILCMQKRDVIPDNVLIEVNVTVPFVIARILRTNSILLLNAQYMNILGKSVLNLII